MSDEDLIKWAVTEILELDELCRGQVPNYLPLQSDDMQKIELLKKLASKKK